MFAVLTTDPHGGGDIRRRKTGGEKQKRGVD